MTKGEGDQIDLIEERLQQQGRKTAILPATEKQRSFHLKMDLNSGDLDISLLGLSLLEYYLELLIGDCALQSTALCKHN